MLCIEETGVWCVQCTEMVGQVVRAGTGRQVALYKYIHGTEGIDPLGGGGATIVDSQGRMTSSHCGDVMKRNKTVIQTKFSVCPTFKRLSFQSNVSCLLTLRFQ